MVDVLAVDDSPSMRALVKATLEEAGLSVVQAEDGLAGLELAQKERARVCLVDVNMPRMDGITLVGELRKLPEYKFTPILMLTTEVDAEKKARAKAAGATGWLVKPFDPPKLIATIRRVLQ